MATPAVSSDNGVIVAAARVKADAARIKFEGDQLSVCSPLHHLTAGGPGAAMFFALILGTLAYSLFFVAMQSGISAFAAVDGVGFASKLAGLTVANLVPNGSDVWPTMSVRGEDVIQDPSVLSMLDWGASVACDHNLFAVGAPPRNFSSGAVGRVAIFAFSSVSITPLHLIWLEEDRPIQPLNYGRIVRAASPESIVAGNPRWTSVGVTAPDTNAGEGAVYMTLLTGFGFGKDGILMMRYDPVTPKEPGTTHYGRDLGLSAVCASWCARAC